MPAKNNAQIVDNTAPPAPCGAAPSARQLAWHRLETYGFVHFTVNTFTGKEWGYGDEAPALFNPTEFDAGQIAETAAAGGLAGLILTCKHHDGFCLWPSRYTGHSVKHSPWRNGRGDVVREISDACRNRGLKFGVYLSPWDRNHPEYGRPAYLAYYQNQLRELLTEYGELFEVWFDGANGGDGYYGGARERRAIDHLTYYRWPEIVALVRELQPQACIFGEAGADIRWVGNEMGHAGDPCWHTIDGSRRQRNLLGWRYLEQGEWRGNIWQPAECDVSIRPGWFYHAAEDERVRTPHNLLALYFHSVGRGAALNLNLPPDRRGLIHARDAAALREFRRLLDAIFARDLARAARVEADNTRGNHPAFQAAHAADGRADTYWCADDHVRQANLTLVFPRPVEFNAISLREYLPLGQRIAGFAVSAGARGGWRELAAGLSIGHRRLLAGETIRADRLRVELRGDDACPALAEIAVFKGADLPWR